MMVSRNKPHLLFSLPFFIFTLFSWTIAQEITVFGQVSGPTNTGLYMPIHGAEVSVPDAVSEIQTVTDENGDYELTFLWNWDGPVTVLVSAEGYQSASETVFPEGQMLQLDFLLEPLPLNDICHLHGRVWIEDCTDSELACILPGTLLSIYQLNSPMDIAFTAYSDELGYYTLDISLFPEYGDEWIATLSHEGFELLHENLVLLPGELHHDFALTPQNTDDVVFHGHVFSVNPNDIGLPVPLPGALVRVFSGLTGEVLNETVTDNDGGFGFSELSDGATQVEVSAEGYMTQTSELILNPDEPVYMDFYLEPEFNPEETGWIFGIVTGQLSPMGPTFPIEGAFISATPAWGPEPNPSTTTDEDGLYEMELNAWDIPWIVTCSTEMGTQTSEVMVFPENGTELNFNFYGWEDNPLTPPQNLQGFLTEDFTVVHLIWEPPLEWPLNCLPEYRIYYSMDNSDWQLLTETSETDYFHPLTNFNQLEICYQITAFCGELESDPSNTVCIDPANPMETAVVQGYVSFQYSPEGPTFPLAGAEMTANPEWGYTIIYTAVTDENGFYQMEVIDSGIEIPWLIGCITEYGTVYELVPIEPGDVVDVDFHFNLWELPQEDAPRNLTVTLTEDQNLAVMTWEPPLVWPLNCLPEYHVYAGHPDTPDQTWELIGDTSETIFEFPIPLDDLELPAEICFQVTAFCDEYESNPSNIVCIMLGEFPIPSPPFDLNAVFVPEMGPSGGVSLTWSYPPLPDPVMLPVFQVYANLGWQSGYEFELAGTTELMHFDYLFGDFIAPDTINCFMVNAVVGDAVSEFSNTECVNPYAPAETAVLFGHVYQESEDGLVPVQGAEIQVLQPEIGIMFTVFSHDDGGYEIELPIGMYLVTCTTVNGEVQSAEILLDAGDVLQHDFIFGDTGTHAVFGYVHGLENGLEIPLPDAIIAIAGEDFSSEAVSSGEGYYLIEVPYPGFFEISAEAEGYHEQTHEIMIQNTVSFNFFLEPMIPEPSVFLALEDAAAMPGDTLVLPIRMENSQPVGGLQFTLTDTPDAADIISVESGMDCMSVSFNNVEGSSIIIFFSLEGCVWEAGSGQIGELHLQVSNEAAMGTEVLLELLDVVVSDPLGGELTAETLIHILSIGYIGDINGDADVNVLDVVQLVNFIILVEEPDEYQIWSADLNEDSVLNVLDVVQLVNLILFDSFEPGLNRSAVGPADIRTGENIMEISGDHLAGFELTLTRAVRLSGHNLPDGWRLDQTAEKLVGYSLDGSLTDYIRLTGEDLAEYSGIVISDGAGLSVAATHTVLPEKICLYPNAPNPFNPETEIRFDLAEDSFVHLAVYDMMGHEIQVLDHGVRTAGEYHYTWQGSDQSGRLQPSGVYFCRLTAGDRVFSEKMVLMK